jgi:hypothetical protein
VRAQSDAQNSLKTDHFCYTSYPYTTNEKVANKSAARSFGGARHRVPEVGGVCGFRRGRRFKCRGVALRLS